MIVQLTDWLYQGDWGSVVSGEYQQYKIGAVINVAIGDNRKGVPYRTPHDLNFLLCPFDDPGKYLTRSQLDVITHFAACFRGIGVLVHCQGGGNRSSIVCALLLCALEGMSEQNACLLMLAKNPIIDVYEDLVKRVDECTSRNFKALVK